MSCLSLMSCNTTKVNLKEIKIRNDASLQIDALNHFSKEFLVMPGQVTLIQFPYLGPFKDEALSCNNNPVPFFTSPHEQGMAAAYLARPYFDVDKAFACEFRFHVNANDTEFTKLPFGRFVTRMHPYPREQLNVDLKRVILSQSDQQRAESEKKMLKDLYLDNATTLLFNEPFIAPLQSKITSIYGTKRLMATSRLSISVLTIAHESVRPSRPLTAVA